MALPTQSTEPISENLNSRPQFKEYQNVLNMLADKDSLIYNYALEETVRLTESLVGCWKPTNGTNESDAKVTNFVSKSATHLSEYNLIHYGESSARLELLLRAMSSVLHIVSNSVTMIQADIRDSLYKSVSKYWQIYRNTNSMNANVTFTLREIRTCLRKIKDDRPPSAFFFSRGGDIVNVVVSVLQKEYLSAFVSFLSFINFEYAAGTWYYKWEIKREKYFISRQKYLKDTSNPKEIERFYKKLHKSSNKEFDKVKRKNTTYRNFEYKILKSGGAVAGCSLPDHIDTLLIGYLDLTQRLLEEFFTQMENYIRETITLCDEIIETNIKKQLTFKAVEILYIIKKNSKKEEIKDEIELKFEYWSNYSQPPQHKPDDTLITPNPFDSIPSSSLSKFNKSSKPNNILIPPIAPMRNSIASISSTSSSNFNKTPLQPPDTPTSIYTPPLSPLNTPTSHEEQRRRSNVWEIMTPLTDYQKVRQQQSVNTRKRVVDDVKKLFEERRKVCENIKEIKAEYELLDDKNVGEDLFLTKLKEILEKNEKERENRESRSSGSVRSAGSQESGINNDNRDSYYCNFPKIKDRGIEIDNIQKENGHDVNLSHIEIVEKDNNKEENGKSEKSNNHDVNLNRVEKDDNQEECGKSEESNNHDVNLNRVEKDDDQEEYGESEKSNNHDVNLNRVEKDDDQEEYGESEESNNHDVNLNRVEKDDNQEEYEESNNHDVNLNRIEIVEKDNNQEEYGKTEDINNYDVNPVEITNRQVETNSFEMKGTEIEGKDNNQEEYGKSEESDSHDVNSLINNNEKVDEKDNDQEKYGKSEETNSRDINLSEITNNNKQVETNSFEKKGTEIDGKDNNQEKRDERYDESEERRSDRHNVPEITVEEFDNGSEIKKNVIINEYHVINNVTNVQQSDQEDAFLVTTLRRIAKSIEYIADQAVKGHQAALRRSNSNSSINKFNNNEKEVEKAEEEKVVKTEEEKVVEKAEEEMVVEKAEEEMVVEKAEEEKVVEKAEEEKVVEKAEEEKVESG